MVIKLKSYRLKQTLKGKARKSPKLKGTGDIIKGGITALIGTAFVAQTADVLRRI